MTLRERGPAVLQSADYTESTLSPKGLQPALHTSTGGPGDAEGRPRHSSGQMHSPRASSTNASYTPHGAASSDASGGAQGVSTAFSRVQGKAWRTGSGDESHSQQNQMTRLWRAGGS